LAEELPASILPRPGSQGQGRSPCGSLWDELDFPAPICYAQHVDHQFVDQRSLELNRLIAEKIRAEPNLIRRAYDFIERHLRSTDVSNSGQEAIREWKEILDSRPLPNVLLILTEKSDEGSRLRQSSPFAGIITPEERAEIFLRYEPLRSEIHHYP